MANAASMAFWTILRLGLLGLLIWALARGLTRSGMGRLVPPIHQYLP